MERDPDEIERIGEIVDARYRILAEIGRGGMGWVYRAEHIAIKKQVAIKLLNPACAHISQFNERFQREAFATGRLDHPNCVGITDSGKLADGTTYLVMELLAGRSLATELDRTGRIEPARALRITAHVLCGLAHAHRAGVVHRDLKPENIYLVDHARQPDFAKILDFGIAKLMGDALEEAGGKELTQTGLTIGSPRYLSPEQAAGDPLDARTDLYSLTIVLFEMLTGRRPFESDKVADVIRMHLFTEPPSLRDVAPGIAWPAALDALVRRGLTKAKPLRFQTAEQYLEAVEQLLPTLAESQVAIAELSLAPTVSLREARAPARDTTPAIAVRSQVSAAASPGPAGGFSRGVIAAAAGALAVIASVAIVAGGKSTPPPPATAPSSKQAAVQREAASPPTTAAVAETGSQSDVDMIFAPDDVSTADSAPAGPRVEVPGQQEVQSLLRRGARSAAKKRLLQLRKQHPRNAHLAYWLGSLYFDDSWWRDGFDAYRDAVRLDPATYRAKKEVIVDAMRCFISLGQSWRARDFLVNVIGKPAIPYVKSLAAKARNRNVRRRAGETLRALER